VWAGASASAGDGTAAGRAGMVRLQAVAKEAAAHHHRRGDAREARASKVKGEHDCGDGSVILARSA